MNEFYGKVESINLLTRDSRNFVELSELYDKYFFFLISLNKIFQRNQIRQYTFVKLWIWHIIEILGS